MIIEQFETPVLNRQKISNILKGKSIDDRYMHDHTNLFIMSRVRMT